MEDVHSENPRAVSLIVHSARKKYGLILKVVLKWGVIFFENIMVSLIAGLIIQGALKLKGLKLQWTLRFKTPTFYNFLHFKTSYQ